MAFQPRMQTSIEGISVVGALKYRTWPGVVADLWQAECQQGARGEYVSTHPRLFVVLDKIGGPFETRLDPSKGGGAQRNRPQALSYIPADVPVWGRSAQRMRIRHLDLHLDVDAIRQRLGAALSQERLAQPRIMFSNGRIQTLARLLAAECAEPSARHDLFGDGLVLAILTELFAAPAHAPRRRAPLTAHQLTTATEFIAANLSGTVRLDDLARLLGMSQSHFSHAFKASTGSPPHQWQLKARIERGQRLLTASDRSLSDIATEAGFSDQAHFTRVFRRFVGETPAAWRRAAMREGICRNS